MNRDTFIIEGLAGKKSLKGTIKVNGAKNAALKAMAAAVLFDGPVELRNIPDTEDVHTMRAILEKMGSSVDFNSNDSTRTMTIDPTGIVSTTIDARLAGAMRSSVVLSGPTLARFGSVTFPAPGGCVIGARPIDQFIKGYEKMGAVVTEDDHIYTIEIDQRGERSMENGGGNRKEVMINFERKTVGGTETMMMASVLGDGIVTLKNCAQEPEIVDVAQWLNACGAEICGAGTEKIVIQGTKGRLLSPKIPYIAMPDRVEAGSYLILGALCASDLTLTDCRPDHLKTLIDHLRSSGVPISVSDTTISITQNTESNAVFKSFDVITKEYPGFATDFQPQIVTYLTQVSGRSKVTENIFEGRFKYVADLQKLGANMEMVDPQTITIEGPSIFRASSSQSGNVTPNGTTMDLCAHDLRAGFAVVMAALVGEGKFLVNNVYLIDRGYEKLEERLTSLGVNIKRL